MRRKSIQPRKRPIFNPTKPLSNIKTNNANEQAFSTISNPPPLKQLPPKSIYKVMIIDDSKSYTLRLVKLLERAVEKFPNNSKTLNVVTMTNPVDALRIMTRERFSLCLVDDIYNDSNLSGTELIKRLETAEKESNAIYSPRVLVSGKPMTLTNHERFQKNDIGVGLLHDLLRAHGKALTMFESSQARLPQLSGAARLRLVNGFTAAEALLNGRVLFWGDQAENVTAKTTRQLLEKNQEIQKKGLTNDFVDFLALPSASEGNRMQEAPQLQGGSAFVDKNDWVAKKIGTATRKLSYTFTREALQQQMINAQRNKKGNKNKGNTQNRRHSQVIVKGGGAAAALSGATRSNRSNASKSTANRNKHSRRHTVHDVSMSVPAAMWINKPISKKDDSLLKKQNFWKEHRENAGKNQAQAKAPKQDKDNSKELDTMYKVVKHVQTESMVHCAIRKWKGLGKKRLKDADIKKKSGVIRMKDRPHILAKETEQFRILSEKLNAHVAHHGA